MGRKAPPTPPPKGAAPQTPQAPPPPPRAAWWHGAALPALLAVLLFLRALPGGYTFDDRAAVRDNPDVVVPGRPYAHLLAADFWGAPARSALSNKSYRPLTTSVFRAVRAATWAPPPGMASGGAAPTPDGSHPHPPALPFHALNVALHAAVTAKVHALALALAAWEGHPQAQACATLAALLFAAHPVHVEAVAGLVGAAELLCAFALLAAVRAYGAACAPGAGVLRAAAALAAACALTLAAALSKETGITALATHLATEWLLRAGAGRAHRLPAAAARAGAVVAAGAAYAALRRSVLGGDTMVTTWRIADNHLQFLPTPLATVLTVAHTHWRFMYLLLFPARLCADWNYACIPPVLHLWDYRNSGALALYAWAVVTLCHAAPWRVFTRSAAPAAPGERAALLRFFHAAALLALPLLPAANVIVWVGAYLAERLLYIPSVGFCMMLAAELTRVDDAPAAARARKARCAAAATLLLLYSARTLTRLPDWDNDATLFAAGAATCPDGARARYNAGVQLRMAGDCDGAAEHFRAALRIVPDNNCGVRAMPARMHPTQRSARTAQPAAC
jgi:hypothetical protein